MELVWNFNSNGYRYIFWLWGLDQNALTVCIIRDDMAKS